MCADIEEGSIMALVKCRECGKEISDTAERCPNCGCVTHHGQEQKEAKSFLTLYAIDFLEIGVGAFLLMKGNVSFGVMLLVLGVIGVFSTNKQAKKYLEGENTKDKYTDIHAIMDELNVPYGEAELIAKKRKEEKKTQR